MLDGAQHGIARALDAAVNHGNALLDGKRSFQHVPLDGCSQGNVHAVLGVALQGVVADIAGHGGGSARGRQREGFHPAGRRASVIEVDADEDGIIVPVGNADAVLKGNEVVRVTGHDHLVAHGLEAVAQLFAHGKVDVRFPADAVARAAVMAAVAGINDYCVETAAVGDVSGAQNRVNDFVQVHIGNHQPLGGMVSHRIG